MKSVLFIAALFLSVSVSFASNGNGGDEPKSTATAMDPGAINKAIGAIKSACPNATGNLQYSVDVVSACFVDGFVRKVTFYRVPNCPPNQVCIQVIETVGFVTLDCDNNVISVECGIVSI